MLPAIVKPASSGSSVGISIVRDEADLMAALIEAAKHGHSILIEELIPGIEATCGVIEGFRGEELYALPPIEIRSKNSFFDYEAKYQGKSEEIVPAKFSEKLKRQIEELSRKIHRALGLRHYSRSDFIIHPRRGDLFLRSEYAARPDRRIVDAESPESCRFKSTGIRGTCDRDGIER